MLTIGKITGFHGLNGEVKIPYSERLAKNLAILDQVYVCTGKNNCKVMDIESYRIHKTNILLKFKQYSTKTDVEYLKNALIQQEEHNLAPLEEEEYFVKDLIGMDVYNQENKHIGTIESVLSDNASNDLLEIKTNKEKLSLVPFVEELVPEIDIENNRVVISSIPGLIEDEI